MCININKITIKVILFESIFNIKRKEDSLSNENKT